MKIIRYSFAAACFTALLAFPPQSKLDLVCAQTQEPKAPTAAESGPPRISDRTYKIDATLVNVDVLVTDEDGRVLSGLKRDNFRVFDNGVPQQIIDFSPTTAPITIVMLMEYSSASYSYFADKAAIWGTQFVQHLDPKDWVALVTYDLRPKVQVDFTHQQYEIRDTIASLGFPQFREINLYDALTETLDMLDRVQGRTSILLLSTGTNSFSAANLDEVLRRLKQTDTVLFCVGLGEAEYVRYGGNLSYMHGKATLENFARQTGGLALFPRFEGELPDIFRSVVGYLRSEYTLTFRPPVASRDGLYHRLKIEIVDADGKALKVTNEKGKRRKIEVFARQGYIAPKDKTP